jgi:hypothetical protein
MVRRTRKVSGGLVVLLASGAVLAACGGGKSAAAASSPASTSSTSTVAASSTTSSVGTTSGAESASSEAAFAKRVNLSVSDFPSGWGSLSSTTTEAGSGQTLEACATSSGARIVKVVSSPIFSSSAQSVSTSEPASVPPTFVSVVAFAAPPSSAGKLAAAFVTSAGLDCLERTLADVGSQTGGQVHLSDFSASPSHTSVAGTEVEVVALGYDEAVSSGTFSERVSVHERVALFAKGGALIELSGVDLTASDAKLFRTILGRLVARA